MATIQRRLLKVETKKLNKILRSSTLMFFFRA